MPLLSDADLGDYVSLFYVESQFKAFNDFCRSITGSPAGKVASTFARVIDTGIYSSTLVGWIDDPGGANEYISIKFPEYCWAWLLAPNTQVAGIQKTLLMEEPAVDPLTEAPCYQCSKKNYVSDKVCWWCSSPNPTGVR
jgi:hypothetical protein